jgi:hypothetical protein
MRTALPAALFAALLLPVTAAQANPAISVSSERVGSLAKLPAKVKHKLTLTAGATEEPVAVSISPAATLTVTGDVRVAPPAPGTGSAPSICPTRWSFLRPAYGTPDAINTTRFTIAPGGTAVVEGTVELVRAPYEDEGLDATWDITPAQGREFDVVSVAPFYTGPLGVAVDFRVLRARDGSYVIAGTTTPNVNSGRVELWAYPPSSKRARRIMAVRVRDGEWETNRFAPGRRGTWELYARYRTAGRSYADGASTCGTEVRVR